MLSNIVNTTLKQPNPTLEQSDQDDQDYDITDDFTSNYYTAVAVDEYDDIYTTHNPDGTAILTKFNQQGDIVYTIDISKPLRELSFIDDIVPDLHGNIYLVGVIMRGLTAQGAIYKYTTDGKLVWRRYKETKDDNRFIRATYVNDRIYAIGYLPPKQDSETEITYLAAYTSTGKLITSTTKSTQNDTCKQAIYDIKHDKQGNIYVAGSIENPSTNQIEAFITKLSPSLKTLQYKTFYHSHETYNASITVLDNTIYTATNVTNDDISSYITSFFNKYDHNLNIILTVPDTPESNTIALKGNNGYNYAIIVVNNNPVPQVIRLDPPPRKGVIIEDSPIFIASQTNIAICSDGSIILAGELMLDDEEHDDEDEKPAICKYNSNLELLWSK